MEQMTALSSPSDGLLPIIGYFFHLYALYEGMVLRAKRSHTFFIRGIKPANNNDGDLLSVPGLKG